MAPFTIFPIHLNLEKKTLSFAYQPKIEPATGNEHPKSYSHDERTMKLLTCTPSFSLFLFLEPSLKFTMSHHTCLANTST